MKRFIFLLLILSACHKEDLCCIGTFSAYSCVPGEMVVVTRRLADTPMDSKTCEEMRDRMIKELKDSGDTYLWYGNEVQPEDLIYCSCQ